MVDNDCDLFVDCADADCSADPLCAPVDCSLFTNRQTCRSNPECTWVRRRKVCE